MTNKRIFVALPLEPVEPAAAKMTELQGWLTAYRIKWVRTENFHVTIFFFGEVPEQQLPQISRLLSRAVQDSSAFSFSLTGPGIFKKGREPRVLWLGIGATDPMVELKATIDQSLIAGGFMADHPFFRPHLTLGRFLAHQEIAPDLGNALKSIPLSVPIDYQASKLILFESILFSEGPQYLPLEVFPLGQ